MIELINNKFGIDNTISIPILISLIVFITGGVIQLLYNTITNFYSRKLARNSFRRIIIEISKKCKQNAGYIETFYPTLNIEFNQTWTLKTSSITYLELIYMQDYKEILNAFNKFFRYRLKTKIGSKAFHKIWSVLENLKSIEKNIHNDFKTFHEKLNRHELAYSTYLKELQELNDTYFQPYIGRKIVKSDFNNDKLYDHLIARDKIIREWQKHENKTRKDKSVVFNEIIRPLRELNFKNQGLEVTLELNTILINAEHEYEEMVRLLSAYSKAFYNYYWNYRYSFKVINKCMEIIK